MLIIPIKDNENIERALKRYKKKNEKVKTIRKLRSNKEFLKPSVVRRQEKQKAVYAQKLKQKQE